MPFCYKVITETPRRSAAASPTRRPVQNAATSLSQLIGTLDYDDTSDVLNEIPERDWRLLAVLAKKREEDDERERLADQFREMWKKEKMERDIAEAESMDQYKLYRHKKRQQEDAWNEYKKFQKNVEQQLRTGELLDCIRDKELRSQIQLAYVDDKKVSKIIDKALEEKARAQLAADRRTRLSAAEEFRKQLDLADTKRRADDALKRKNALLRDASKRVAISNALSSWETTLARQEVSALDAARRAAHAASAALTDVRSARIARARDLRLRRARKLAAITARMREAIRSPSRLH